MNSSYALPNFSSDYQGGCARPGARRPRRHQHGTVERLRHCERARRAAHVEDLVARLEREQVQEPTLVVAGRVSRERRGPLVPISLRVSVDRAVLC